ncbi:MAG: pirin family protein [Chloroflexi bacterium]|nr:pirin family protein [Chloroflexota bacterium]
MITIRKSDDRGHADHGWLKARHTFSFANYYDPDHVQFRSLRVMNEDRIAPANGFGTHPHRDMEIVTYMLDGALAHKDSMGHGAVLHRDEVQVMTAGTGVTHSEFNDSESEPVHLLQIWIEPEARGLAPQYDQRAFAPDEKTNTLKTIASPDGADGSLTIHQDVRIHAAILKDGRAVTARLAAGRHAWVQVARGVAIVNGQPLSAGDGAAISDEEALIVSAPDQAEILLFDLA